MGEAATVCYVQANCAVKNTACPAEQDFLQAGSGLHIKAFRPTHPQVGPCFTDNLDVEHCVVYQGDVTFAMSTGYVSEFRACISYALIRHLLLQLCCPVCLYILRTGQRVDAILDSLRRGVGHKLWSYGRGLSLLLRGT